VLKELDAFMGVWRSATPDLQAVDVWICKVEGCGSGLVVDDMRGGRTIVHCSLVYETQLLSDGFSVGEIASASANP